jgi:hypothetical protein
MKIHLASLILPMSSEALTSFHHLLQGSFTLTAQASHAVPMTREIGGLTMWAGECFFFWECTRAASHLCYSFVDRDMMMRYHWGLGVGHTYAHHDTERSSVPDGHSQGREEGKEELNTGEHPPGDINENEGGSSSENELEGDGSSSTSEDDNQSNAESDDGLIAFDDMYGC